MHKILTTECSTVLKEQYSQSNTTHSKNGRVKFPVLGNLLLKFTTFKQIK